MAVNVFGGIVYEEYESELVNEIPAEILKFNEMGESERCFLNGIIRYHNPRNILELGVSAGGGTVVLLNAIKDRPECRVVSVDLADAWYRDRRFPVGFIAKHYLGEGNKQWEFHTNSIAIDVLEKYIKFDLVVLDTAHVHPIESLDFLMVLPFLSDDAIVVMHDISSYTYVMEPHYMLYSLRQFSNFPKLPYANRLLFDVVCANKARPCNRYCDLVDKYLPYSNIGAFQINADTHKYISDVFSSLEFTWGMYPDYLHRLDSFFMKHYSRENVGIFRTAARFNYLLARNDFTSHVLPPDIGYYFGCDRDTMMAKSDALDKKYSSFDNLAFYGAGQGCKFLLDFFDHWLLRLPDLIWDKNADNMEGDNISAPPRKLIRNCGVIITLYDEDAAQKIKSGLREMGFDSVFTAKEIFR